MKRHKLTIKEGDSFVAYNRETMQKALSGGICKCVKAYNKRKNEYTTAIPVRKDDGQWDSVNAIDAQGNRRIFKAASKWGFLKR